MKIAKLITKNIDVVINLSALIGIPILYKSPKSYINNNIIGTHNLLESSIEHKVKNLYKLLPVKYMEMHLTSITENFSNKVILRTLQVK